MRWVKHGAICLWVAAALLGRVPHSDALIMTFTNSSAITIPSSGTSGPASPFPSNLAVSGILGTVTDLDVLLTGLVHARADDLDILLVGPTGVFILLMSDVGGPNAINANLTLDDEAPGLMPGSSTITSGTFRPTNIGGNDCNTGFNFAGSTAPGCSYPTDSSGTLSLFDGLDPNGIWNLFIVDDGNQRTGSLASWSLTFTYESLQQPLQQPTEAVPEPATLLLLGTGLVGIGAVALRNRGRRA